MSKKSASDNQSQELFLHIKSCMGQLKPNAEINRQLIERLDANPVLANTIWRNRERPSFLQIAISHGFYGAALHAIGLGANVHYKDANLRTAVHDAAKSGNIDFLKALHENGADIHARGNTGYNALHNTAVLGVAEGPKEKLACMKYLLEHGVSPMVRNGSGNYPFHVAAKTNFVEAIELLASKADMGTVLRLETEKEGRSALHLLVYGSARDDLATPGDYPQNRVLAAVDTMLRLGADPEQRDWHERTPAHDAALAGYAKVFHRLVEAGADPNAKDCAGNTPLHHAIRFKKSGSVLIDLLKAGSDLSVEDGHGVSAAELLLSVKHEDAANVLGYANACKAMDAMAQTPGSQKPLALD